MEQEDGEENVKKNGPSSSYSRIVAIAINGGSKSMNIVKWALQKFGVQGPISFKLIHVFPKIIGVPTPMGNLIHFSQVRDDVVIAYKKEIVWQKTELILPYQRFLTRKKISAEVALHESDEIWDAISTELAKGEIKDLVIGASSNGMFARKFRGQLLSSLISESAPSLCRVYVVSKGKLESLRPSQTDQTKAGSVEDDCSARGSILTSYRFTNSSSESSSTFSELSLTPIPRGLSGYLESGIDDVKNKTDHPTENPNSKPVVSLRTSSQNSESRFTDQVSTSSYHSTSSIEEQQKDIISELDKLRIELRHIRGVSQDETGDAATRGDLNRLRHEEEEKLKQIKEKEEIVRVLARLVKEKFEAAKREAEHARDCAVLDAFHRREAELLLKVEKPMTMYYQMFTWEEIVDATCSFAEEFRIGEGSFGCAYKCRLNHMTVAVKVLNSKLSAQSKHFLQELEIMSTIRHPNLLSLLGSCPDPSCLVYEYMENGNLEDRLLRKNDTPPIPWYDRFRIVSDVASTLAFLHNNKPNPIVHGAIKASKIYLDDNFVPRVGPTKSISIDPDHQRLKMSVKDDVWGLGIVIWQLLTGRPAVGITRFVEGAIKDGRLGSVLDSNAGRWPFRETAEMALLGVRCADIGCRDRPDLDVTVLPLLERIEEVADEARDLASGALAVPPSHFICPILQDVMEYPCVASDGYTYDRKAIELWINDNDTSPTTNFPLKNKYLAPNYSLLHAIKNWKSDRKLREKSEIGK